MYAGIRPGGTAATPVPDLSTDPAYYGEVLRRLVVFHRHSVTTAMMRYARGVASAALGQPDAAERERALFYDAFENVPADRLIMNNQARAILGVATEMLNGKVEYHRGNYNVAFTHLRQAVVNDDRLNDSEPWSWMHPPRHALGALLLAQGHIDEAEQVYRADLRPDPYRHGLPNTLLTRLSMWSLKESLWRGTRISIE